ncbi:hypothetical protein ACFE04_022032 [Oxalis oulophora]
MANTIAKMNMLLGFVCFVLFMQKGIAREFAVGPSQSWGVPSSQDYYNKWAESNRFQMNDSLVFVYPSGNDSVLQVTKENYDNCSSESPIAKFEDGHTVFSFKQSGPFYFISGKKENCLKGEKLVVVVLADRSKTGGASSPAPAPGTGGGTTPSPAPGTAPGTNETTPSPAPGVAPKTNETTPSPAPAATGTNETTPTPAPAAPGTDVTSPPSPAPDTPSPSPSPSPAPAPESDQSQKKNSASTIFFTSIGSIGGVIASSLILTF